MIMKGTAAAAKSLQSCPTLSDPMDSSLPGSSVHGIFQARVLEWVAIAVSESFTASGSFQMSQYFASGGQSTGGQDPTSPGDSQESSPTPQFKSINSSVLSFLYGPTLTSIHDY